MIKSSLTHGLALMEKTLKIKALKELEAVKEAIRTAKKLEDIEKLI